MHYGKQSQGLPWESKNSYFESLVGGKFEWNILKSAADLLEDFGLDWLERNELGTDNEFIQGLRHELGERAAKKRK